MIKHLILIVDSTNDELAIIEALEAVPSLKGTDIIITDTVKSAMTTMQVMTIKGSMN